MEDLSLDIRWKQRLVNYSLALKQLVAGIEEYKQKELSDLEKQGLIKAFEITQELSWNLMKDYLEYQGNFNIRGSRDAIREAFRFGIIQNGKIYLKMIETRNLTAHTYNQDTANRVVLQIVNVYIEEFINFEKTMNEIENETR
ncbi:MAG TPA: nucleotidyltransferase substrate binding protein [Candidatus Kapabacteria bacterium]|nr:nucleotidyltransferase substrate binding protein [Candidatus Kapabacteria bacterium]HPO63353.1 nucleotidyltransferase substrate binding protein [Candidatus Kapabacteria bacterium]